MASAFRRKIWIIGAPIAAVAIVILAVLIARRDAAGPALAPTAPPTTAQAKPQPVTPPVRTAPSVETAGTHTTPPAVRASRDAPRTGPVVAEPGLAIATTAADDQSADDIAPLREIAPITVAAIAPRSIASVPIQVPPLGAIAELQMTPLTSPEGRH